MIDGNSTRASEYIDSYRSKMKHKFQKNKEAKKSLISTLRTEELTPEKIKEIDEMYKSKMKDLVKKLQSEENFDMYQKKYREDTQQIRQLLNDASSFYGKKGEKGHRDYISKLFPKAKKAASEGGISWDEFVEDLGIKIKKLKESEKEKVMGSLEKMFSSKENFFKAIQEFKDGMKSINATDVSLYVAKSLFFLLVAGMGISMLDNESNHLIWKLLGASRFVYSAKHLGGAVKDLAIAGGENDVNKVMKSHQFDHGA